MCPVLFKVLTPLFDTSRNPNRYVLILIPPVSLEEQGTAFTEATQPGKQWSWP